MHSHAIQRKPTGKRSTNQLCINLIYLSNRLSQRQMLMQLQQIVAKHHLKSLKSFLSENCSSKYIYKCHIVAALTSAANHAPCLYAMRSCKRHVSASVCIGNVLSSRILPQTYYGYFPWVYLEQSQCLLWDFLAINTAQCTIAHNVWIILQM